MPRLFLPPGGSESRQRLRGIGEGVHGDATVVGGFGRSNVYRIHKLSKRDFFFNFYLSAESSCTTFYHSVTGTVESRHTYSEYQR